MTYPQPREKKLASPHDEQIAWAIPVFLLLAYGVDLVMSASEQIAGLFEPLAYVAMIACAAMVTVLWLSPAERCLYCKPEQSVAHVLSLALWAVVGIGYCIYSLSLLNATGLVGAAPSVISEVAAGAGSTAAAIDLNVCRVATIPLFLYGVLQLFALRRRRALLTGEARTREQATAVLDRIFIDGPETNELIDTASWEFKLRGIAWPAFWSALAAFGLSCVVVAAVNPAREYWPSVVVGAAATAMELALLAIIICRHPGSTTWKSRWLTRRSSFYIVVQGLAVTAVPVAIASTVFAWVLIPELERVLGEAHFYVYVGIATASFFMPLLYVCILTREVPVPLERAVAERLVSNNSREAHP